MQPAQDSGGHGPRQYRDVASGIEDRQAPIRRLSLEPRGREKSGLRHGFPLNRQQDAEALADAGGVLGVWTKGTNSPKELVENIKMVVDAIGVNHVGIGTDTDLLSPRPGTGTNRAWPGMTGGFFPVVVEEFLRQGFTAEEIGMIGGGTSGACSGQSPAPSVASFEQLRPPFRSRMQFTEHDAKFQGVGGL